MPTTKTQGRRDGTRLVAKILRDCLATASFEDYTALKTALRRRLAALRIPYQQFEIEDAVSLIATNRPVVNPPPPPQSTRPAALEPPPISHREAVNILREHGIHVRTMRAVRELTPAEILRRAWEIDQAKAFRLVMDEIEATAARASALEAALEETDPAGAGVSRRAVDVPERPAGFDEES